MLYRVVRVHEVEAVDAEEAERLSLSLRPREVLIREAGLVRDRHAPEYARHYQQPIEVLDLAWDAYMDALLPSELREDPRRPSVPSLARLGLGGIDPVQLSLLFDLAITAVRERSSL